MGDLVRLFPEEQTEEQILDALREEIKDFLLESEDEIFQPLYFAIGADSNYCPCCMQPLDHPLELMDEVEEAGPSISVASNDELVSELRKRGWFKPATRL